MDQYSSNSEKSKRMAEQKKFEKHDKKSKKAIAEGDMSGTAKKQPTSTGRSLLKKAIATDISYIGDNILNNTIRPMIVDMIEDGIGNAVHMVLHPDEEYTGYSHTRRKDKYRPYNKLGKKYQGSASEDRERRRAMSRASRRGGHYVFENIEFEDKDEAIEILDILEDAMEQWGEITVGEFYQAAKLDWTHNDERWGWIDDLGGARVKSSRGCWVITLPEPEYLDD